MSGHCMLAAGRMAIMITVTVLPAVIATCGMYGTSPPTAIIGEKLTLICALRQVCLSGEYEWYHITDTNNIPVLETSNELVVSDKVTSVAEVGGKLYECHCSVAGDSDTNCRLFKIAVQPVATLKFSHEVTKAGDTVNITCTVESYPSADKAINYKLIHSQADPIQIQILPSGKGIYHTIDSASKEQDAGKYECVVSLSLDEYPNSTLQSDRAEASLTVYDPPVIRDIHNYTTSHIPDLEQAAILECAISNTEDWLDVWVNWTTVDSEEIRKRHVTLQKEDVFYLLLSNASTSQYLCKVFSEYSDGMPEAERTLAVEVIDTPQDCDCWHHILTNVWISGLAVSAVVGCIIGTCLLFKYRRSISSHVLKYYTMYNNIIPKK